MCRPWKWLWGLLPLAFLFLLAMNLREAGVQSDLVARSDAELRAAGQPWARVDVAGRDAALVGDAPNETRRTTARDVVDRVWGVRRLADQTRLLPTQSPYVIGAAREGNRVTLTGFAPSMEARDAVVAAARAELSGVEIVDRLALAAGAPAEPAWLGASRFAFAQLARLSEGRASLSNMALSVEGRAATLPNFGAVRQALGAIPAGATLAAQNIRPPVVAPYTWAAVRDGDSLTLSGFVPTDADRARIAASAQRLFVGARVTDSQEPGDGAPPVFGGMTDYALERLAALRNGRVAASGAGFAIEGTASTPESYAGVRTALGTLPAGVALSSQAIVPPTVSPFTWGAELAGRALTLTGFVPSDEARAATVAAARAALPGAEITDRMLVAAGTSEPGFRDTVGRVFSMFGSLTAGTASLRDGALSLVGQARDFAGYDAAVAAARAALPQGFTIASAAITPAPARPFTWSATRDAQGLTLGGHVASDAARAALLAQARTEFPGATVTDRMQIASGAPQGEAWASVAGFALSRLSALRSGRAGLDDEALALTGEAPTSAVRSQVVAALGGLPAGVRSQTNAITVTPVSPFVWSARREAGTVTITGHVPGEDVRREFLDTAQRGFAGHRVDDQALSAPGAAANFQALGLHAMGLLARLDSGSATITDTSLRLEGRAATPRERVAIERDAAARAPAGAAVATSITVPPVSPFVWNATREGGRVTATGFVPSEAVRTTLVAALRQRFPTDRVDDEALVAPGAPAAFEAIGLHGVTMLARIEQGSVSISDAALRLEGRVATIPVRTEVERETAASAPAGTQVTTAITVPPVSPYLWSATRDGRRVTLTGYVPSVEARARLVAAVRERFTDHQIDDQMQLGPGQPAAFEAMGLHGLAMLGRLDRGSAAIRDTALRIEGQAPTMPVRTAVERDATASAPAGTQVATAITTAAISPYVWQAQREAQAVTLTGYVPDEATRRAILEGVKEELGDVRIDDRLQIGPGAAPSFRALGLHGLAMLGRIDNGTAAISDTTLRITGDAVSPLGRATVERDGPARTPSGTTTTAAVTARIPPVSGPPIQEVDQCERVLSDTGRLAPITFATGRADLLGGSEPRLFAVADALRRCATARVEVAGHTDSDGSEAANLTLSRARAQTVVDWLEAAGVDRERMTAAGYGESQPIASNDTAEGKAQNRRIEFVLQR